jgi:hypothetical protein
VTGVAGQQVGGTGRLCGREGGPVLFRQYQRAWLASAGADGTICRWRLDTGTAPYCDLIIELLPQGSWVTWHDPDGPDRRWVHWSPGAWRWLGWHAPLPDGKHWMHYPMDAFVAPEPAKDIP